jgi:hypothetical protein
MLKDQGHKVVSQLFLVVPAPRGAQDLPVLPPSG